MSYGIPTVTTERGARGIYTNSKSPMIMSSIAKFTDNIKRLNADHVLYSQISEDARSVIREQYDWKKISNRLQDIILEKIR